MYKFRLCPLDEELDKISEMVIELPYLPRKGETIQLRKEHWPEFVIGAVVHRLDPGDGYSFIETLLFIYDEEFHVNPDADVRSAK